MSRRGGRARRALGVLTLTAALVLIVAAALVVLRPGGLLQAEPAAGEEPEPVTAPVELTTLVSRLRLSAQLGYGEPAPLPASEGVLTAVPAPGAQVAVGEQVYEADGRPVVLLRGARPMWRELSSSVSDGEDVRQLEENLAALGFFDREPDVRFDWWTQVAVRDWQASLGLPRTGVVAPADVVVVDSPGIRIAQVTARLGEQGASPGTFTETTLRATARLTEAQARELSAGDAVTVELPGGEEVPGTFAAVDPGGEPIGEGDQVTSPSATIEFDEADLDTVAAAGPVAVRVVVAGDGEGEPTLVVPVTALVATADGGYAVEVLDAGAQGEAQGDRIVRVPVEIGLVADARVQVLRSGPELGDDAGSGSGTLAEGDEVVIAR